MLKLNEIYNMPELGKFGESFVVIYYNSGSIGVDITQNELHTGRVFDSTLPAVNAMQLPRDLDVVEIGKERLS